jgi:hypothetical protein
MRQAFRSLLGIQGDQHGRGAPAAGNKDTALRIDLRGRIALVTGATGQLGRVIV